jgi:tetratricopeptide (TPR) repeat protein
MAETSLEELLRQATVRVMGPRPGAGFFVAPNVVVTCAHVVGRAAPVTVLGKAATRIKRLCDGGRPLPDLDEDYPDVAVVWVDIDDHPCVVLDDQWPVWGDRFQTYGFPNEGGSAELLTPGMLDYRGTKGPDATAFVDLKSDTVKPGMSGGALLNLRTRAVCGIVIATRNPAGADGGLAVSWREVAERVPELVEANHRFHAADRRWSAAVEQSLRRVQFRLPRVVADFTGRAPELAALERALGARSQGVVIHPLTGLGGVGKTQLAAKYVHTHAEGYDVVAWVRAEDGGVADLAELAVTVGLEVGNLPADERTAMALGWLERSDRSWLLVLDNLAGPSQLKASCPAGGNGHVLVTSRHRGFGQFGAAVNVEVFDDDTAVDYLVGSTPQAPDAQAARRLAAALGGLPLALSHARAFCAESGTTFDDYLHLLESLPAAEVFDRSPEAFYEQTVASTWRPSIEAASTDAPLAGAVLAMAAYLAPESIPKALFGVLVSGRDPRQRKALAAGFGALHRYSLAEVQETTLNVHRLLQTVVRDATRSDASPVLSALRALNEAWPADVAVPVTWPECERLLPHVLALGRNAALEGELGRLLVDLLNGACTYILRAGAGQRGMESAELAAAVSQRLLGPEHPDTLTSANNLAGALRELGDVESARRLFVDVYDTRQRLLGPEHPDTLLSGNNLAGALLDVGDVAGAHRLHEEVYEAHQRLLGPDDPHTLRSADNLAMARLALGDAEGAHHVLEEAYRACQRLLGPEHPDTLASANNLAGARSRVGDAERARQLFQEVYEARRRVLGPDHPDTLRSATNLASARSALGDIEGAHRLQEDVHEASRLHLGPKHPDTLTALNNLAETRRALGDAEGTRRLHEEVYEARRRVLGPEHPDTLLSANNLAGARLDLGDAEGGSRLLQEVYEARRRVLGPEHPDTLLSANNLAGARLDAYEARRGDTLG